MGTTRGSALALWITLLGCGADRVQEAPEQHAELRAPAATPEAVSEHATASGDHIAWGERIAWRSWESALSAAQSEGKSICVVVYTDWCPRCKELAPVFSLPAIVSAAEGLLMVRQDQDAKPAWLKDQLGAYGGYVPRILFVGPDGKVREDIQSGHPRYPYFYGALIADQLVANMRSASGG